MKIVLFSTSDQAGGAAIACIRLGDALQAFGHEVHILVMEKLGKHPRVIEVAPKRRKIDSILKNAQYFWNKKFVIKPGYAFSTDPWWDHDVHLHPIVQEADVLNLHWVNHGYFGLSALEKLFSLQKPVIWHMHDYWAFTGGCHYPADCLNFLKGCGSCPALIGSSTNDVSRKIFSRKRAIFEINPPVLVGASAWLTTEAAKSALVTATKTQTQHIFNPIDLDYYAPGDKATARSQMGLSINQNFLLFAAMNTEDPRKGFAQLKAALKAVATDLSATTELLVAGKANQQFENYSTFKVHFLGSLNQAEMRQAYQAADAFIIPSLEENLPNTVLESLACGTPVAGFKAGGIPEMVIDGQNGYLAEVGDALGLAHAISATFALSKTNIQTQTGLQAFEKSTVAASYTTLALNLLSQKNKTF